MAAVTPEFAKVILGIIGFIGAGIQILGIIGVMKVRVITSLHHAPLREALYVGEAYTVQKIPDPSLLDYHCRVLSCHRLDRPFRHPSLDRKATMHREFFLRRKQQHR